MSDNRPSKRKKSGAEYRKAKKAKQQENNQLGSFMLKFLQHEDRTHDISIEEPESETVQRSGDEVGGSCESETPLTLDTSTLQDEQRSLFSHTEKALDVNLDAVKLHNGEDSPKMEVHHEFCSGEDVENLYEVEKTTQVTLQEQESVKKAEEPSQSSEKRTREFLLNQKIVFDEVSGTFDPASLVGLKLSTEDKVKLIKMNPCQPSQSTLKLRKKQFGERSRYCSQQIFFHDDDTRRKWKTTRSRRLMQMQK